MIDAHQHFWQLSQPFDYAWLDSPDLEAIRRDYLPSDLKPHLDATGVRQSIFVQTQHNIEENRWVLRMAEETDWLVGVVGWVDLASESCEEQLLEFKDHPKFVGVRHVTHDEPDDDFIVRPGVLRGLKVLEKHGVPFDLLFHSRLRTGMCFPSCMIGAEVRHRKREVDVSRRAPGADCCSEHGSVIRASRGMVHGANRRRASVK